MTGTPYMPAAPSWLGTNGVRDGDTWGDTGLEGQLCQRGGERCWEPGKILDNREKPVTNTRTGLEKGAGGWRQTGVLVLVPSSGE